MFRRLTWLVFLVVVVGLASRASALVVNNFQEWNQRTQLADLGGLEITSTGHARFTARVDHDATDLIIHPGGILETLDTYKLPDGRPQPELSNAYVYGTWNAHDIQSFGVQRAAYIYLGPEGEINIASNTDSGASYSPLAWLDEAQLGGRSLLLAPELDPAVWSIQIEDLGGGAYRITAVGPPPGGAAMPSPEDGAKDVARDTVLSWTPGPFAPAVNGHRLYLSDDFNDVNNGVGGVTLSESNYSPEKRLELGTKYYWRVDEVNGAPDVTVYPGDVWSFETEPVALTVPNVTAVASSTASNQGPPSAVVDGSGLTDGLHSTNVQAMWSSAFGAQPTWIQFEFDRVYLLHEMWVWNSNTELESSIGYGFQDVTIEYSNDGVEYSPLGTTHEFARAPGIDGYAHNTVVDFSGVQAKYVKLTVNTNWALFPFPQFGLSEVRFLHIPMRARNPQPDPGATDVSVDVTLAWRSGRKAAEHNVYLGTDEQAVIDGTAPLTTVTEASLSPSSLELASTYYWRVDEANDVETPVSWQGDAWSFSTQEFIAVEDFESYNNIDPPDPESNRIFESWLDGYADAANGSLVGHDPPQPSYLETTTFHSGMQSLPFFFDNSGAAASETQRTFGAAQDWTRYGVQTLSLWFYGGPGSTGQLYVKINGAQVAYDGDASNLSVSAWQVWNIDLTAVATNLQSVTSLTIGVEGLGAKGMLLVDDVRLYPYPRNLITPVPPDSAGLVAHYMLDGNANDSAGNAHGTVSGSTFVPGKTGQAINLTGMGVAVSDYVDCGNPSQLDFGTGEWTVSAWIKAPSSTDQMNIFGKGGDGGGGIRYVLSVGETTDHRLVLTVDDNATKIQNTGSIDVDDDQWHHVVGMRDADGLRIYVDGFEDGDVVAVSSKYDLSGTSQANAYIGAGWNSANSIVQKYFTGSIDDVRVYNYALSASEIRSLSGATLPYDEPF